MKIPSKIIKRLKKRDRKTFAWLFSQYKEIIKGIALRYTKNEIAADDILQETFIIAYEKITQYEGRGSFEGWLKRITINLALKHLKELKKELAQLPEDYHQEEVQEQEIDYKNVKSVVLNTKFTQEEIMEAVKELPDGFRTIFNLYVVEGYKHKEIAQMLGISESTSKTQLLRARKNLQKKLYKIALEKHKQMRADNYKKFFNNQ